MTQSEQVSKKEEPAVLQSPGDDMLDGVETFSQEVRKAWAVSFHESRRAQRAKNNI